MTDQTNSSPEDAGTTARIRESATHAYDATRETAATAARKAGEGIESNPLAVLVGGLAVGAVAGALLPKTQSEQKVLGPLGKRLSEAATAAAVAARDAGREQINAALPDKDAAREKLRGAFGTVVQAAKDGGKAGATGQQG